MRFLFDSFLIHPKEYAKICSEINTNYSKYEGKAFSMHFSFGIDEKSYIYYFENHGYNDYNIYYRSEISDEERRDL
jgi:hypothetical protein